MTDSTAEPMFPLVAGWEEHSEIMAALTIA